jgi:hypothetical protein
MKSNSTGIAIPIPGPIAEDNFAGRFFALGRRACGEFQVSHRFLGLQKLGAQLGHKQMVGSFPHRQKSFENTLLAARRRAAAALFLQG